MILLIHKKEKVVKVTDLDSNKSLNFDSKKPLHLLFELAEKYQNRIIIWCHASQEVNLNIEGIKSSFNLKNMMLSYSKNQFLPKQIGYIEDSPFLKVNKLVKYPTWLMSSDIGAIHASQLIKFEGRIDIKNSFDFALNTISKIGMPNGLLCYSDPKLLNNNSSIFTNNKASINELFKFVKCHYKWVWSILLLINMVVYEKKWPVIAFLKTLFFKQNIQALDFNLEPINPISIDFKKNIDVIIPTLGRKKYVHNVLKDLSKQSLLPEKVIIVEQNEDKKSKSELDFISNRTWPFKIVHKFIYQTGACNARNLALKFVTSDYVYLADDDNEFDENLLKEIIYHMEYYGFRAIAMSYLQKNEVEKHRNIIQWNAFGGGSSVIASEFLKNTAFNLVYEFGYGEDTDFGMQLRDSGADVLYVPNIKILHLKAPIGGFRTPFVHPWEKDEISPKPSPTVMLNRMENSTKQQLLGYKTTLFLKYYRQQAVKNPVKYYSNFKQQWKASEVWANRLSKTASV